MPVVLYNVYVREVTPNDKKKRPFQSASVCVSPVDTPKDDRVFYNVKAVQGFGELPKNEGFYTLEAEPGDIWVDTQEGVENTIRVRNPKFARQDYTIYETEYNQLNAIPQHSQEVKRIKVSQPPTNLPFE